MGCCIPRKRGGGGVTNNNQRGKMDVFGVASRARRAIRRDLSVGPKSLWIEDQRIRTCESPCGHALKVVLARISWIRA